MWDLLPGLVLGSRTGLCSPQGRAGLGGELSRAHHPHCLSSRPLPVSGPHVRPMSKVFLVDPCLHKNPRRKSRARGPRRC